MNVYSFCFEVSWSILPQTKLNKIMQPERINTPRKKSYQFSIHQKIGILKWFSIHWMMNCSTPSHAVSKNDLSEEQLTKDREIGRRGNWPENVFQSWSGGEQQRRLFRRESSSRHDAAPNGRQVCWSGLRTGISLRSISSKKLRATFMSNDVCF